MIDGEDSPACWDQSTAYDRKEEITDNITEWTKLSLFKAIRLS